MGGEKLVLSRRTRTAALLILLFIPLTIALGAYYYRVSSYQLSGRIIYLISAAVIVQSMVPFLLIFEKRKPQARELVVLSVLTALAVAGRIAFFWLPQIKPVGAIVIITGVCFGGEAGFIVGVMTAFVSNFYFGQGLFTPFQMFSFGILGFLAGVLFKKGRLAKKKPALCIYGALSTMFIYGFLVDISTVMSTLGEITWPGILAIYIAGISYNLLHAAGTVLFLYLLADPLIEKLDRIKIKYGLLEP